MCGLKPARTYLFVARAMNDYGYGHASPISSKITMMGTLTLITLSITGSFFLNIHVVLCSDLVPEMDESDIPILSNMVQGRLDNTDVEITELVPISPTQLRVSWTVSESLIKPNPSVVIRS